MITRLRPAHAPMALAEMYALPHRHGHLADHVMRVDATVALGTRFLPPGGVVSGADLSCGDGTILRRLPVAYRTFGDLAPGYPIQGPIEQTLDLVPEVNLFVLCETLEHLNDPAAVLTDIRAKADGLLLSTPVGAWNDPNAEHYWAWDRYGVEGLLHQAGWRVDTFEELDLRPQGFMYSFGIWGAL